MNRLITFSYLILSSVILILPSKAMDMELAPYHKLSNLSGKLRSVGSDTLGNEMRLWAEAFRDYYPNVAIDIESKRVKHSASCSLRWFSPTGSKCQDK